jgi:hypothetical protein
VKVILCAESDNCPEVEPTRFSGLLAAFGFGLLLFVDVTTR